MKKWLATAALWFWLFDPGIPLGGMTPQLAAARPTIEALVKTATVGGVLQEQGWAWLYLWLDGRRGAGLQRLAEKIEAALGTPPGEEHLGTFFVFPFHGSPNGAGVNPFVDDLLVIGHPLGLTLGIHLGPAGGDLPE